MVYLFIIVAIFRKNFIINYNVYLSFKYNNIVLNIIYIVIIGGLIIEI